MSSWPNLADVAWHPFRLRLQAVSFSVRAGREHCAVLYNCAVLSRVACNQRSGNPPLGKTGLIVADSFQASSAERSSLCAWLAVQSVCALLTLCLCTTPRVIFASFCCTKTCYGCHTNHNEAPVGELGLLSSSASSSSVACRRAWPRFGGGIACPSIGWLRGWGWPMHRRLLIGANNHNEAPVGELRLTSSSS